MSDDNDALTSKVFLRQCENGDELCLYCLDGDEVVYADVYPADDESEVDACAQDFHTVAMEGIDPVKAGWARTDEAMGDDLSQYGDGDAFADTDWYDGTQSSVARLGNDDVPNKGALRRFVMSYLAECE